MIKVERGSVWSIEDCYYGNSEKGREPIKEFINIINQYSDINLLETILGVEGLASGVSSHASGVLCLNEPLENTNSYMRTPSGELITAFDLHQSESVSNTKYDFLLTNGVGLLQQTMQMLVDAGHMEWQGSLRDTYNKYLHPDVIDRTSDKIWDSICNNQVYNLFQFFSPVGAVAMKKLQPRNLLDLANANSLMRLMNSDGGEQPLDKYIRFKNEPKLWIKEMEEYGLNKSEIETLKEEIGSQFGVCSNQENMMTLLMNKKTAGFGVVESNIARKAIAKKKAEVLQEAENLFFEWGTKLKTRKEMLDYCWYVQTGYQRGYSFSILHTTAYSIIAIQEANLVCYYPPIYWATANLLNDSGSLDREMGEDSDFTKKEKTTNYGKVAKAIGNLKANGIKIALPEINMAEQGFIADELNDQIIFGLKGTMKINNETSQTIIANRPYSSLKDFHKRLVLVKKTVEQANGKIKKTSLVTSTQTIILIKAGAFDNLENKPREQILENYLQLLNPPKKSLTATDIGKMGTLGIIPPEYNDYIKYYNFRKYIMTFPKVVDEELKSIQWIKIVEEDEEDMEYTSQFFLNNFSVDMEEGRDYKYDENGILYIAGKTKRKGSFEYVYEDKIQPLIEWSKTKDCLDFYNKLLFDEVKKDNMDGSISTWEMEALSFYYHEHELAHVNREKYSIVDFNTLSEEPEIVGYTKGKGGVQYPKYNLSVIVGTILDKDTNKNSITLLTLDGVITVKLYKGEFNFYNKDISQNIGINEKTGKMQKVTVEEGWLKRGNKLLITGFRREDNFFVKRYKNSVYQHALSKIIEIDSEGDLMLQSDRVNLDEDNN